MEKGLWMLLFCFLALPVGAQNEKGNSETAKSVEMKEVTVEAARVTKKLDGMLIVPSDAQREAATDGYSLLGKLSLPRIRVDEVMRTIVPLTNNGSVQLRLNGTLASKEDLLALDPKLVKNIDFINNPGVRYGDGIGYVIDIRTKRNTTGYVLGADLSNAVTTLNGDNTVYAKLNHKNSELALTFNSSYNDHRGFRSSETADYTLNNGSHYLVSRNQTVGRSRRFGNQFEIKYSLADSATYVFQASLSTEGSNTPGNYADFVYRDGTIEKSFRTIDVASSFAPKLDLYFFHQLGKHQSITANVVGSGIYTDKRGYNGEEGDYAYEVNGRTWSLESEAIYENKLKPFTLSAGLEHSLSFTNNEYTGDVSALNKMRRGELYLFSEVKGRWKQLGYSAGVGVANKTYSQENYSFDYWTFRPKVTLSYEILAGLNASYSEDVLFSIWRKACVNGTMNATCAILDANIGEVFDTTTAEVVVDQIIHEFVEVAHHEGVKIDEAEMKNYVYTASNKVRAHYPSMHQDLMQNHRFTEIDYLNGFVAKRGLEYGIPTPYCAMITQLIHAKEQILKVQ